MADPKKSYNDIITWAKGTSNDIIAKQLATARTISITNNSGTALASGTFNGTGNLTLKLPATVGIDISGNAATATTATTATNTQNVKRVNKVNEWLSVVGIPIATGANANGATGTLTVSNFSMLDDMAESTAQRYTVLRVGNATAVGTSGNRAAALCLYGTGTQYVRIKMGTTNTAGRNITLNSNLTADRTYTLPDNSGTIALTSQITSNIFSINQSKTGDGTVGDTSATWWYTCNKLSNNMVIIYGFVKCTSTGQSKTITFPSDCAPASNNYVAVAIPQRSGAAFTWCSIGAKSTTSFTIQSNSYNGNNWCTGYYFIVIG